MAGNNKQNNNKTFSGGTGRMGLMGMGWDGKMGVLLRRSGGHQFY